MLGNLTVEKIEERLGIIFSEDLKCFLNDKHQNTPSELKDNQWHCFDLPFMILCGGEQLARDITNKITSLPNFKSEDLKEQISISWK
jgi:hypothetical protein